MKIKLYKLLEMIDKGEELPEKIKLLDFLGNIIEFKEVGTTYLNYEDNRDLLSFLVKNYNFVELASLEIKTIEDTKIKPLEINENEDDLRIKSESGNWLSINSTDRVLAHKINEIIKYINKEE